MLSVLPLDCVEAHAKLSVPNALDHDAFEPVEHVGSTDHAHAIADLHGFHRQVS